MLVLSLHPVLGIAGGVLGVLLVVLIVMLVVGDRQPNRRAPHDPEWEGRLLTMKLRDTRRYHRARFGRWISGA